MTKQDAGKTNQPIKKPRGNDETTKQEAEGKENSLAASVAFFT